MWIDCPEFSLRSLQAHIKIRKKKMEKNHTSTENMPPNMNVSKIVESFEVSQVLRPTHRAKNASQKMISQQPNYQYWDTMSKLINETLFSTEVIVRLNHTNGCRQSLDCMIEPLVCFSTLLFSNDSITLTYSL